jgi:hypothetical protein
MAKSERPDDADLMAQFERRFRELFADDAPRRDAHEDATPPADRDADPE